MKTTKASTNATTYEEYLKLREEELMEERDHWIKAWKDMYKENAELKARVAGLEKFSLYLSRKRDEKKAQLEEMYRISCKETDEAVSREKDEAVIAAVEAVELRLKAYWLRNR